MIIPVVPAGVLKSSVSSVARKQKLITRAAAVAAKTHQSRGRRLTMAAYSVDIQARNPMLNRARATKKTRDRTSTAVLGRRGGGGGA